MYKGINTTLDEGQTPIVTIGGGFDAVAIQDVRAVNRQNRKPGDPCHTLARDNAAHATIVQTMQVRRLTPVECERLQGFPDGYTNIPWRGKPESPDGPRYKALGNSMAVPVMRWIGERINEVSKL
jgi:DNA (cytosine-5)-methyltransferase 1